MSQRCHVLETQEGTQVGSCTGDNGGSNKARGGGGTVRAKI